MNTDTFKKASFRIEVRNWLKENCPENMRGDIKNEEEIYLGGRNAEFSNEDQKVWFQRMLKKGWIAPKWDIKYGGGGLSSEENMILAEEMVRLRCKPPLVSFGLYMLGPALLKFGSEEQKQNYLPEIIQGKVRWCQGYSEPNAGSDLSSLKMKAEDKGDYFLLNGSKIWTSDADNADCIFCLVRTSHFGKQQEGISFILVDMSTEGLEIRPIRLISGESLFFETFFTNVKVPKENIIGGINNGWTVAKYLLTQERQALSGVGDVDQKFYPRPIAVESLGLKDGVLDSPILRAEIVEHEMNRVIYELTLERALDEARTGVNSGAYSSIFKYCSSKLNVEAMELIIAATGHQNLLLSTTGDSMNLVARNYLRSKGYTIEGGTAEIHLNIISKNILGLPTN